MDVRIMVSATRGEGIGSFPALRAALEFVQPVSVALVMSPALVAPSGSYLAGAKKEPRALADQGTSHMICTADALNARRISAARGGAWHDSTMSKPMRDGPAASRASFCTYTSPRNG